MLVRVVKKGRGSRMTWSGLWMEEEKIMEEEWSLSMLKGGFVWVMHALRKRTYISTLECLGAKMEWR